MKKGPFKMKGWSPFTKTTTIGEFATKHSNLDMGGQTPYGGDIASKVAASLTHSSGVTSRFERNIKNLLTRMYSSKKKI